MISQLLRFDNLQVMLMASLIGEEQHGLVWLVGIRNKLLEG